jgi:hypothetical protein
LAYETNSFTRRTERLCDTHLATRRFYSGFDYRRAGRGRQRLRTRSFPIVFGEADPPNVQKVERIVLNALLKYVWSQHWHPGANSCSMVARSCASVISSPEP